MSIVEFLDARIAEDEAIARAARGRNSPQWISDDDGDVYAVVGQLDDPDRCQHHDNKGQPNPCDDTLVASADDLWDARVVLLARATHIARHDPARILAECAAKRQIVEYCSDQLGDEYERIPVLELLAQPYADHPEYRPEWRP